MTDQEQNIAVAEACGWSDLVFHQQPFALSWGIPPGSKHPIPIPEYGKDINAMAEAVRQRIVSEAERNAYVNYLFDFTWTVEFEDRQPHRDFFWCEALAAYRREAFLRTLGLWKETTNKENNDEH